MNNLQTIDLFTEQENVLFFGYPGSGVAVNMAKIACRLLLDKNWKHIFVSSDPFQIGNTYKLKMLASCFEMKYQESAIADLEQLTAKNCFIYLRCPTVTTITKYQSILYNPAFKKVLVLDCTRKNEVNTTLIRLIGKEAINGIICTKIDIVQDKKAVYDYLCSLELPVAYLSCGEKITRDGSFPTETAIKELFYA
jgi:flagellar biosynthesis GTPase FlhF